MYSCCENSYQSTTGTSEPMTLIDAQMSQNATRYIYDAGVSVGISHGSLNGSFRLWMPAGGEGEKASASIPDAILCMVCTTDRGCLANGRNLMLDEIRPGSVPKGLFLHGFPLRTPCVSFLCYLRLKEMLPHCPHPLPSAAFWLTLGMREVAGGLCGEVCTVVKTADAAPLRVTRAWKHAAYIPPPGASSTLWAVYKLMMQDTHGPPAPASWVLVLPTLEG